MFTKAILGGDFPVRIVISLLSILSINVENRLDLVELVENGGNIESMLSPTFVRV